MNTTKLCGISTFRPSSAWKKKETYFSQRTSWPKFVIVSLLWYREAPVKLHNSCREITHKRGFSLTYSTLLPFGLLQRHNIFSHLMPACTRTLKWKQQPHTDMQNYNSTNKVTSKWIHCALQFDTAATVISRGTTFCVYFQSDSKMFVSVFSELLVLEQPWLSEHYHSSLA